MAVLDKSKRDILAQVWGFMKARGLSVSELSAYVAWQEKITAQMSGEKSPWLYSHPETGQVVGVSLGELVIWGRSLPGRYAQEKAKEACRLLWPQQQDGLVLPVVWRQIQRHLEVLNFLLEENGMEPLENDYFWTTGELQRRGYLYNPFKDEEVRVPFYAEAKCRPVFVVEKPVS